MSEKKKTFSILVASRNEEKNLPSLIESIDKINYSRSDYEVIIVDDASDDSSWKILQNYSQEIPNLRVFRLEEKSQEYKGKKAALKLAAEKALYDYFLFTDADCLLPAEILNSYAGVMASDVNAVIGWYKTTNASAWQRILDSFSAFAFAVSAKLGIPFSASGMNWVLKREVFMQAGGYNEIREAVAGDDKLLLLLVNKLKGKIIFNYQCPVLTTLPEKFNWNRLKRKYGKFGSSPLYIKAAIIILAILLLYLPLEMIHSGYQSALCYLSGIYFLWFCILIRFRLSLKMIDFLILAILPYALMYLSIVGGIGNWEWKDQKKN